MSKTRCVMLHSPNPIPYKSVLPIIFPSQVLATPAVQLVRSCGINLMYHVNPSANPIGSTFKIRLKPTPS